MKAKLILTLTIWCSIGLLSQSRAQQFNRKDLIGSWQVDIPKMMKATAAYGGRKMDFRSEMGTIGLVSPIRTFKADGTYTYTEFSSSKAKITQKWKLEGNKIILYSEGGKGKTIELASLDKHRFVMKSKEGGQLEFLSLNSILSDLEKTNKVSAIHDKIVGDWNLIAIGIRKQALQLGFTYTFAADGQCKLTSLMKNEQKGTWKLGDKNSITFTNDDQINPSKIVYFTDQKMVLIDNQGYHMVLERKQ